MSKSRSPIPQKKPKETGKPQDRFAKDGTKPKYQSSRDAPAKFREKFVSDRDSKRPQRQSLPEGLFLVEGAAAIREYLRFKPQTVKRIFVKERQAALVRKDFADFDVKFELVKEDDAPSDTPGTPVWAHVHHELMDWLSFESYLASRTGKGELVLVLDHISDPRNLGAIVRSAAFFGVKKIIVPERRQVLLTQAGVGTAQGGFALCDLVVVVNVARTLEELKAKDFWILGAAMNGESVDGLRGRYDRQVLVLGSEDKGISTNVLDKCDVLVSIPGAPRTLDSLNVSVAAGILLQRLILIS